MKKLTIALGLVAMLALPGVASAASKQEVRDAARQCRADRAAMGVEQFNAQYGNLGRCIRQKVRAARAAERAARRQAKRKCREEGLRGRALARCIRAEVREELAQVRAEAREERNAARECRAELEAMGEEAFREQYGTNRNKRNAFGKCVSAVVQDGDDDAGEQPAAEDGGDGEQQGSSGRGRSEHAGRPA